MTGFGVVSVPSSLLVVEDSLGSVDAGGTAMLKGLPLGRTRMILELSEFCVDSNDAS